MFNSAVRFGLVSLSALVLASCGGGGGEDDGDDGGLTPATYSIGGTVAGLSGTGLVLQNNGGNNLAVSANGAFTFSTALSAGAAYNVTVQAQPTNQNCTVSAGSGSVASAAVTNVQVSCTGQVAKFLYVPNALSNDVSAFSINASTGVLTAVAGSPFAADQAPSLATADPAGKFLYVINRGTSVLLPSMSVYAVNATSGVLTENANSPFELTHVAPAPSFADTYNKPVVHRSGSYGYITSVNSGRIYGASADASGTLTEIPGMNTLIGRVVGFGDFDATGSYLLVPYGDSLVSGGRVSVFQFNEGSGVLTPAGSYPTGGLMPRYSAMAPNNKFLFVVNLLNGAAEPNSSLAVFGFSAASGGLTALAGSPFSTGAGSSFVVVHPTGNFVYVNNSVSPTGVTGFKLNQNSGVLTPIAGSPFATPGSAPVFLRIDPTGKFLYTGDSVGTSIHGFAIDPTTGALTPVPGSPFTAGTTPHVINMDPSGRFLYATNSGSNSVSSFVINATTGALTLANTVATGTAPVAAEMVGRQ